MTIMLILASVVSGAVSGMGIGGGVILIPVLTSFFDINQKSAQLINLIYFIPSALCALIVHAKNKRLSYKTALFVSIGGIVGALLGSYAAVKMSVGFLKKLFGFFLAAVGISQLATKKQTKKDKR